MGDRTGTSRNDASSQASFPPPPSPSPKKSTTSHLPGTETPKGDGFTAEEINKALKPKPAEPWHPTVDYTDCEIRDLIAGPKAVTFMGRVANILDVVNTPKTPRSVKGCFKLCVKDDKAAITVRVWYADCQPKLRLGSLVSIWTNHVSNGENGTLSSSSAPLFASLFPERDRSCHLMVHENSDSMSMYRTPLGYRKNCPLGGVMTLQNFIDGGYDVADAKILVVVKSIGHKKKVTRKDESTVDNVNLQVHDDTAEATLGLWGTSALTPFGVYTPPDAPQEMPPSKQPWKAGEIVLLLQAPGWKIGRTTYLSLTSSTLVDIDPVVPDATWLHKWSLRQKSRETLNPPFPTTMSFTADALTSNPIRCLFTLADLDEFARAAPRESFQGYLSVLITEVRLVECWRRGTLLSGECCSIPVYANATTGRCKGCEEVVPLRVNPRILGQVIDETGAVAGGKLLLCDAAWRDLLGRNAEDLLKLRDEQMRYLADRLLFCRISIMFGWAREESEVGGRICVLGVRT